MQILDMLTSPKKTKEKNYLLNSNNINLQNYHLHTQDSKNIYWNHWNNPPSIGLSKDASKIFPNPSLLMLVMDNLNASQP